MSTIERPARSSPVEVTSTGELQAAAAPSSGVAANLTWPPGGEQQLLVQLLRWRYQTPGSPPPVVASGTNWASLSRLATDHRVAGLLHERIDSGLRDQVPEPVREALRHLVRSQAYQSLKLAGELLRISALLERQGVPVLPVKGPVVAHFLYGDLGLRSFRDLDLLVRRRHLDRADQLLVAEGYACDEASWSRARRQAFAAAGGHHYGYWHPQRQLRVELHWRLSPGKLSWPVETEAFWGRTEERLMHGQPLRCSPAEDMLLALCIHGARHWWSRLNWICDIAELLRRCPALDWDAVDSRAHAAGGERMLGLGVRVAHDVLHVPLPEAVRAKLARDPVIDELVDDVRRMLFQDLNLFEGERGERWRFYMRLRERFRDRVQFAAGQVSNTLFWQTLHKKDGEL